MSDFALENIGQIIQHFYQALSYLLRLQRQETDMIHKIYIFKTTLLFPKHERKSDIVVSIATSKIGLANCSDCGRMAFGDR